MAWRRGTQNQQAGEIRKGHIKEFLVPSSKSTAAEDERVALRIVEAESLGAEFLRSACAYANPQGLPEAFRAALARDGCVHVHAHEHPAVVQRVGRPGREPKVPSRRKIHVPAAARPRRPPRNWSEDPRPSRGAAASPSAELVGSGRRVRRARAGRRRALGVAAVEQPRLRPRRADVHVVSRPPRGVRRARGGHRRDGREFGPRRAAGGLRL